MEAVKFILSSAVQYIMMIFHIKLPNLPSYGMMLMFAFFLGFFIMCLFGLTRREINGALNDTYQARREERDLNSGRHVSYKPRHSKGKAYVYEPKHAKAKEYVPKHGRK